MKATYLFLMLFMAILSHQNVDAIIVNGLNIRPPSCENKAFAPARGSSGQFTTGPCTADAECLERCCDFNNKCRAPLALTPGIQFCRNSLYTPNFFSPTGSCKNASEAHGVVVSGNEDTGNVGQDNWQAELPIAFTVPNCRNTDFAPVNGPGKQVPTSACTKDDDCLTGCCDFKNKCRVSFALKSGAEFCRNGFTPVFSGNACTSREEAFGSPIFKSNQTDDNNNNNNGNNNNNNNNNGKVLVGFTVPNCQTTDFVPKIGSSGMFTTGPCKVDEDCLERCCDLNGKCRSPRALRPGQEFCHSGFTPIFFSVNGKCANIDQAIGDPIFADGSTRSPTSPTNTPTKFPTTLPGVSTNTPTKFPTKLPTKLPTLAPTTRIPIAFQTPNCQNLAQAPASGRGNQFPTGPCTQDDDCSTGCCDLKNRCRVPFALKTGQEFCKNGFTPVFFSFNGNCKPGEGIGAPIFAGDAPVASPTNSPVSTPTNPPPTSSPTLSANDPVAFETPKCRNRAFTPPGGPGNQFTTGPCTKDGDCQTGCCDFNNKCRVPEALKTGIEFCRNSGFTPVFNGPECTSKAEAIGKPIFSNTRPKAFAVPTCYNVGYCNTRNLGEAILTESCDQDSDCDTGCCDLNLNVCIAPYAMITGESFCMNGYTPQFDQTLENCESLAQAIGDPVVLSDSSSSGSSAIVGSIVAAIALVAVGAAVYYKYQVQQEKSESDPEKSLSTTVSPSSPYSQQQMSQNWGNNYYNNNNGRYPPY